MSMVLAERRVPNQTVCAPTSRNIARQDFVDNRVFEFINELLPMGKKIDGILRSWLLFATLFSSPLAGKLVA